MDASVTRRRRAAPPVASIDDDLGGGIGHRAVASSAPAARHVTFGIHGDERRTSSFEPVAHVPHERRPTPSIGFNAARAVSAPLAVASVTGVDSSWGSPLPHSREAEAQPLHGGATGGSWLMTFGYPQQYEAAVVAFIEEAAGDAAVEARRSGRRLLLCFATRESMEHGLLADESESAVPGAIISVVPATSHVVSAAERVAVPRPQGNMIQGNMMDDSRGSSRVRDDPVLFAARPGVTMGDRLLIASNSDDANDVVTTRPIKATTTHASSTSPIGPARSTSNRVSALFSLASRTATQAALPFETASAAPAGSPMRTTFGVSRGLVDGFTPAGPATRPPPSPAVTSSLRMRGIGLAPYSVARAGSVSTVESARGDASTATAAAQSSSGSGITIIAGGTPARAARAQQRRAGGTPAPVAPRSIYRSSSRAPRKNLCSRFCELLFGSS